MKTELSEERKSKAVRGPTKFPGIVSDARALGVTRQHLFEVLVGHRRSPLLQRYQELKSQTAKAT